MTPRTGVYVGIAGFVLGALCATPLLIFPDLDPTRDDAVMGVVVLGLGALLGLTVMVVGLIIAGATALTTKRHPLS